MKEQWNERYSKDEYNYGKQPNAFLKEELPKLNVGKILFIGEGEGRNSVFAATLGWEVDAIDFSEEGKRKAEKLADGYSVKINYQIQDFSTFTPPQNHYDAIGIFYIHLNEDLRTTLFDRLIESLKPTGRILFECFEKDQINYSSGGPKNTEMLYSLEDVATLFIDLEFEKFSKEKIILSEGEGHKGEGIVIRFVGQKP